MLLPAWFFRQVHVDRGRVRLARQRRVPPYVVALDRTLVELATKRPRTLSALASIHGMGPVRIEQFGAGFLAVASDDELVT